MLKHLKCNKTVSIFSECFVCSVHEFNYFFSLKVAHGSESDVDIENAEDGGAYGGAAFGDDDTEFSAPTPQQRRKTPKRNWITPRLCCALDKAKVNKMRLKK